MSSEPEIRDRAALMLDAVVCRLLRRPWLSLAIALVVGALAVWTAAGLDFDTRLAALLPESAPEVHEIEVVSKKAGGTVELVVAVGGKRPARLPFARELVEQLKRKPWVRRADVEFPIDFFLKRRAWLLSTKSLRQLKAAVFAEIDRAKARANPFYVDLEEEQDRAKPWAEVEQVSGVADHRALLQSTFESPDGKYLFVRIKPKGVGIDFARGEFILSRTRAAVAELGPERRGLVVRYAGGLVVNQEQHQRMMSDIRRASVLALVLVLLLTTVYIQRWMAPVVLAVPLIIGVAVTLALTALSIGQLNLVSGFLVSALIGLGVAFGVHLYMRFLEHLPRAATREAAMRRAFVGTFPACFTAAATTAAAFLAMTISDFRGFREYGQIAAGGVMLTLTATFLVLPPLAMVISRRKTVRRRRLPLGFNRRLAVGMLVVGVGFFAFSLLVSPRVGWRNDFRELRGHSTAVKFYEYVQQALGGSLSPAAVMVDSVADARRAERIIEPYTRGKGSPIIRTISLASMVPSDIAAKRAIFAEVEAKLQSVLDEKLGKEDRERIEEALELARAKPWSVEQIPEVFRKQFLSIDGKNTFVLAWPRSDLYLDAELFAWADLLAEIQQKLRRAGIEATVLDENRIGARVVREVRREWPKVFAYAALAVILLLALDFRSPRKVLMLSGALGVGLVWIVGGMYLADLPLNIFNHSVLPTILGIGIDNAVHVQHRYDVEGPGSIPLVIGTTGSAALLASATTAVGFGASITAHHFGVNTLGWLAIVGIGATFIGSTIFFPSVLFLLERKRK